MGAAVIVIILVVVILLIVGGIYASKSSSSTTPAPKTPAPKTPASGAPPAPAVGTPAQYASNPATTTPPPPTTTTPAVVVTPPASPPAVVTPSAPVTPSPVSTTLTSSSIVPPPAIVTPLASATVTGGSPPAIVTPLASATVTGGSPPAIVTPLASAGVTGGSVQLSSPIKFVRIARKASSPGGLSININEIQAYDASNNLIPFTISMYGPDGDNADGLAGFPASNARDGNLGNFAHTNESMKSFIQVGFASDMAVAKLVVYPRPSNKNRMIGTQVQFFNGNGQEAAPSININEEKDVYKFEFKSSGGASSWTSAYIRYLRNNRNYLRY